MTIVVSLLIILASIVTMPTITYTREDLLSFEPKCADLRIPLNTYHILQDYGICSVKPTHRGHRVHHSSCRGSEFRNLISVVPTKLSAKMCTLNARSVRNKT